MQDAIVTEQTSGAGEQRFEECPQCQASMPVNEGYATWCDQCGHNLTPYKPEVSANPFERAFAAISNRNGDALFAELKGSPPVAKKLSPARLLAYFLAVPVYVFMPVLALTGFYLLFGLWPNLFAIWGGALALLLAWVLRPRLAKWPPDVLEREKYPGLYGFVDAVATGMGARSVDGIVVDADFNASFAQIGFRRRTVLTIGLPLFCILEGQQRVALVGHELAHGTGGDSPRGSFLWQATNILFGWEYFIRPGRVFHPSLAGLLALPGILILWVLGSIPGWVGRLMCLLVFRDSQRCEYRADHLGAQAAGTAGSLDCLERMHYLEAVWHSAQLSVWNRNQENLLSRLKPDLAHVPQREVERIRRIENLKESRLDSTHPPTCYRIELLKSYPVTDPCYVLTPEQERQIDDELKQAFGSVQHKIADMFRNSIYY